MVFNEDVTPGIFQYSFHLAHPFKIKYKVFLYGDCGKSGYVATTACKHSSGDATQSAQQGGYFIKGGGNGYTFFTGKFRYFGETNQNAHTDYLLNFGKAYSLPDVGDPCEFSNQKIAKRSRFTNVKLFGKKMIWRFEQDPSGYATFTERSFFHIEKICDIS